MTPDEAKRKLAEMLASRDDEDEKKIKIRQRNIRINFNADKPYLAYSAQKIGFK